MNEWVKLLMAISAVYILHNITIALMAKIFGVRIQKFNIFYSWFFSLLKIKVCKTQFKIGWMPLGSSIELAGSQLQDPTIEKDFGGIEEYYLIAKSSLRRFT